ncbi:MAG: cation transporter [Saprospiraceae bacterium]|nr:cation transporter [Saprospiraceae bacterium]
MDCPSEESLIKLKLADNPEVKRLEFDLPGRQLIVYHQNANCHSIEQSLAELTLGEKRVLTEPANDPDGIPSSSSQKKVLWLVLVINGVFFLIELVMGFVVHSMGLLADSLDMLADAFVYGLSLLAVGGTLQRKKTVATLAGYAQLSLACLGMLEVLRRFVFAGQMADPGTMMLVSFFALLANGYCLYLLKGEKKEGEAHIQASYIFTSNDVIINLGVILAGLSIWFTGYNLPDLIIGTIIFIIVLRGAFRILRLG